MYNILYFAYSAKDCSHHINATLIRYMHKMLKARSVMNEQLDIESSAMLSETLIIVSFPNTCSN